MDSGRINSFFDQYFNEAIKRVIDARLPPHLTYLLSRNHDISDSLKQKIQTTQKELQEERRRIRLAQLPVRSENES